MDERRIRVGVLGAGSVVRSLHLPVLRALPDIDVRWVCDPDLDAARAAARTFGIRAVRTSLEDCPTDVDVVLVAIPVGARRTALGAILERKHHAFCEKPFAASLADHRWMLSAAREAGLRLGVALVRRVYGSTTFARRLLASGTLGEVTSVSAGEGSRVQRTGREEDWYQASARASGGGVLMETGPHLVDQVMTICDVTRSTIDRCDQTSYDGLEFETIVRGTLELRSGARPRFRMDVSRLRDVHNGIVVRCEKGELRVGLAVDSVVEIARGDRSLERVAAPGPPDSYAAFADAWVRFLALCRAGGPTSDDDTGLLTTAFIDECYAHGRASVAGR